MGDKLSGALTKLKGSLTHQPGVKVSRRPLEQPPRRCPRAKGYTSQAAGTRRMHDTDGRVAFAAIDRSLSRDMIQQK